MAKSNKGTLKKMSKAMTILANGIQTICENEEVKSTVLGKYADGKTRSVVDAAFGEFLSPKQKKKKLSKEEEKKSKKSKK